MQAVFRRLGRLCTLYWENLKAKGCDEAISLGKPFLIARVCGTILVVVTVALYSYRQ